MHRAYKYRLYPTDEQSAKFNAWFAAVRLVYNAALEQRNIYGRSISKDGPDYWGRPTSFDWRGQTAELLYKSKGDISGIGNDLDLKWIVEQEVPKDCLDAAVQDLHKAFKNFFGYIEKTKKKIPAPEVGYPKPRTANKNNSVSFKAFRRQKVNGISVSKPNIVFGQDSVKIPKIGRVRYNRHKKFYGNPKTVEVIREGHEYHVILVTEHTIKSVKHAGEAIGVDLGVKLPVCLSNGEASWPDNGLEELEKKSEKHKKNFPAHEGIA